eukprot:9858629-Prorocentrum_lima.AAC.1
MRSTTHWSTTTIPLTLVRSYMKHTFRPNVVGASTQDAQHVADATDADRTHGGFLTFCARIVAHTTTYKP